MRQFLVQFSNCEGDPCAWVVEAEDANEASSKVVREIDETIRIEDVEEIGPEACATDTEEQQFYAECKRKVLFALDSIPELERER